MRPREGDVEPRGRHEVLQQHRGVPTARVTHHADPAEVDDGRRRRSRELGPPPCEVAGHQGKRVGGEAGTGEDVVGIVRVLEILVIDREAGHALSGERGLQLPVAEVARCGGAVSTVDQQG